MSADFISDRITFRNFNNNILQSYVLNNKHRHSTKVCGEPNHINIATLCIYVLNIIVSHEKLSRSEKSTLYAGLRTRNNQLYLSKFRGRLSAVAKRLCIHLKHTRNVSG